MHIFINVTPRIIKEGKCTLWVGVCVNESLLQTVGGKYGKRETIYFKTSRIPIYSSLESPVIPCTSPR